jgi:phosphatidylinositol 4-kinase A
MYGNNRIQLATDAHLLASLATAIDRDPETGVDIRDLRRLLQILLRDESFRVQTWLNPLNNDLSIDAAVVDEISWPTVVRVAWKVDPLLAVHLGERFTSPALSKEIRRLIKMNPEDVRGSPLAAQILLGESLPTDIESQLNVQPIFGSD